MSAMVGKQTNAMAPHLFGGWHRDEVVDVPNLSPLLNAQRTFGLRISTVRVDIVAFRPMR